jgi:hypothetical protein
MRAEQTASGSYSHTSASKVRCGSNVGTAQGLGIVLLMISALALLLIDPNHAISLMVPAVDVVIYFMLRTRLGNWVQRSIFMSLNFADARIQSIDGVKRERFWEKAPNSL